MEELSLDNILSEEQVNKLFSNEEVQDTPSRVNNETDSNKEEETPEDNKEQTEITEASPSELFGDLPESVGNEENKLAEKDTASTGSNNSSNFYSSIANALVEDGILQNLNKEDISKITTAEDFADAISNLVKSQLDDRYKRINDALEFGLEPSEIQKYEMYISALNNITDDKLTSEDEDGENLRKNLIYQDCINKGFSKDKALKMVTRSIKAGTDIEDAKEALQDNKQFYSSLYQNILTEALRASEAERLKLIQQANALKTSILEEDKAFGEITLDKSTRQKVYDSICKPVYTDPESGEKFTAIQKYELENRTDFLKKVGLLFVLTDGFKSIDRLVNDKVQKETKKNLRNLENTLKSSGNNLSNGGLSFANNSGDTDPESLFKGWKLSV